MAEIRIVVKGKNLDVTPALKEYAEKKVTRFEKYLHDHQTALAEVMLQVERGRHIAEITLDLKGLILRGVGHTSDMYASIDDGMERIERQFDKYKTKIHKRLQGPKLSEVAPGPAPTEAQTEQDGEPQVVRTKRFAVKPMSVEEAVMQMELLGHDFFVFANAAHVDNGINVVYRRKDGNYGLIEPEA